MVDVAVGELRQPARAEEPTAEGEGCYADDYEELEHVVVPSGDSEGYDVRCFKQTELVLENVATGAKRRLAKLFISLEPHVSLIFNVLERHWVEHLIALGDSRWVSSQTSTGLASSHPVSCRGGGITGGAGVVHDAGQPHEAESERGVPPRGDADHRRDRAPSGADCRHRRGPPGAAGHGQVPPGRLLQGAPRRAVQVTHDSDIPQRRGGRRDGVPQPQAGRQAGRQQRAVLAEHHG
ncbi:prolyl 4-hydroxylase alpha-related protein PH4, putative [Babesia caballi]|uniref:Prolyl 4-hydroxylase alpha-related protein PH4, putative n=1 Tax=Babesia caballi TaxID=5871 RepID=A0AAV4M266_BABCB|nr:prolyl 4-hydroxylase alpha-related protein PH4, putative [Babesia caballi]